MLIPICLYCNVNYISEESLSLLLHAPVLFSYNKPSNRKYLIHEIDIRGNVRRWCLLDEVFWVMYWEHILSVMWRNQVVLSNLNKYGLLCFTGDNRLLFLCISVFWCHILWGTKICLLCIHGSVDFVFSLLSGCVSLCLSVCLAVCLFIYVSGCHTVFVAYTKWVYAFVRAPTCGRARARTHETHTCTHRNALLV